jgi:hypothetical protein
LLTVVGFQSVLWLGAGISFCFLLFRLYVRWRAFRKIALDDYLVILAWIMLLGNTIMWQVNEGPLYVQLSVIFGKTLPSLESLHTAKGLLRSILASNILFYCCLWTVKLSLLFFFRRLGNQVRGHDIWWWVVMVITVGSWGACIGNNQFECALKPLDWIVGTSIMPPLRRLRRRPG